MKNLFLLLFLNLLVALGFGQQQILLFTENFENYRNTIDFTTGGVGTNSGINKWIINNSYAGAPLYPDTPPEDSIVSGNITNAPHSIYLHIYDTAAALSNNISDCNWNTTGASDRFCFLSSGFCSMGMTNVTFTFFWVAGGDTSAYGELYYRTNSGSWTKTGRTKYYNQSKWLYEVVTDTAFDNKQNIQFGFRWVNGTGSTANNISLGIDDIIAVGTYDDVVHPAHIQISSVSPDTICQNNYLLINYKLTKPLCNAQYQIELLNSSLQIVNGPGFPVFSINAPDTVGVTALQMPSTLQGNCFHIRLVRVSPPPMIIGDTSICFSIQRCPTSIFTSSAPVMNDNDTTCIQSEIDVKFYSLGTYGPGNTYYAELSDSNGSFVDSFRLGTLPSDQNYQGPPGNISGVIPANVPSGCGYYIRVRSISPPTIGSRIGPFCLKQCDVLTNNITDLHYCIRYPKGLDSSILHIKINRWNNHAHYDTCNNYTVQLLDMMTFAVVNTGGIGVFHDNRTDSFLLVVGPYGSLPVAPGSYYMRILTNCSSDTSNFTGTVIRITIGAPDPVAPTIISPDSIYCNVGFVNVYVNPFLHPPSDYEWLSNGLNNGLPFTWDFNPLTINFTNAPVNTYSFQVHEINFGCPGPWSARKKTDVISIPTVHITGHTLVCLGDTVTYNVTYLPRTYYTWHAPPSVHLIVQGNSQVSMVFDSVGVFDISNFSLNACGSDSGTYRVKVQALSPVQISPKPKLCVGDSVQLSAAFGGIGYEFLTTDTVMAGSDSIHGKPGTMFNLVAHDDLTIDSFACKFQTKLAVGVDVYQKSGSYRGFEQNVNAWNYVLSSNPQSLGQNKFTVMPDFVNLHMNKGDTLGIYLLVTNVPRKTMAYGTPGNPPFQNVLYKSDSVLDFIQGTANDFAAGNQPFGTFVGPRVWNGIIYYHSKAGIHYSWNTGDTTTTTNAFPPRDSLYRVVAYTNRGCNTHDSVFIKVNPKPTLGVGPDTLICDGLTYVIPGTSSIANIVWTPSSGLDNPNTIAPTFSYNQTVDYTINAVDSNGCKNATHLKISSENCTSYFHVPQAFTPNGDGTNDHFTLFANKMVEYELKIYNRWGELVYQTTDMTELNDLSKGWDGTYQGKPQNLGTFVYHLEATDLYNKKISQKGNLTLIR